LGKILKKFSGGAFERVDVPIAVDDISGEIGYPGLCSRGGSSYKTESGDVLSVMRSGDVRFCRIWESYPQSHHVK
jgi:hypothetical protein